MGYLHLTPNTITPIPSKTSLGRTPNTESRQGGTRYDINGRAIKGLNNEGIEKLRNSRIF